MTTTADELVNAYLLRRFREDVIGKPGPRGRERAVPVGSQHLVLCPSAHVFHPKVEEGMLDGTAEVISFDIKVECGHGFVVDHRFMMAGTLADLIDELEQEPIRAEQAAQEKAAELSEAERLAKVQRETMVALFDGDTQVTDWTPFADGKVPLPDEWLKSKQPRYRAHDVDWLVYGLQMRTRDGQPLRASTSVQEHIVRSYAITWRTVW